VLFRSLPTALFGASGATCWRRLAEWHEAGVWQQLHEHLLAELRAADLLDLSAALVDSTHLRALTGGTTLGRARSTGASPAPSTT
jgi:transposase